MILNSETEDKRKWTRVKSILNIQDTTTWNLSLDEPLTTMHRYILLYAFHHKTSKMEKLLLKCFPTFQKLDQMSINFWDVKKIVEWERVKLFIEFAPLP